MPGAVSKKKPAKKFKGSGAAKGKIIAMRRTKDMRSENLLRDSGCIDSEGNPTPKTCKAYRVVEYQSATSAWLDKAISTVSHLPVITVVGHVIVNFTPIGLINNIVHGERIDKALFEQFEAQISTVKEAAPYVQTVISFVPGVGQGVSAAIAAGAALAEGQPITEALAAGARGAIPGGPIAQAVYDLGHAAIQGKNIAASALDAIQNQIPGGVAGQIATELAKKIARGENVAASALDALHDSLPPTVQSALKVGMAIGRGQNLQIVLSESTNLLQTVGEAGAKLIPANDILAKASASIPADAKKGFNVAIGLYQHGREALTQAKTMTVRNLLTEDQKRAFDMATALQIGQHIPIKPPVNLDMDAKAAFYIAKGLYKAPPPILTAVHNDSVKTPKANLGFKAGARAVATLVAENTPPDVTWLEFFWDEAKHAGAQVYATLTGKETLGP